MRLEVIVRFLLKAKLIKTLFWGLFLLLFFHSTANSQQYKLSFTKDTPLDQALIQSSELFDFKIAFNAKRLQTVYVTQQASGNTIDEFLTGLLRETGFTFLYKHGSYLIIESAIPASLKSVSSCQLMGTVVDAETGEQLPFATISVPEQNINTVSSTNGTFSIKNIISNPVHLMISYIGYHTADTLLSWHTGETNLIVKLKQKITAISSVDVVQSKIEIIEFRDDVDFATSLNPGRLSDMPMQVETDIFRTLQLLPGIRYTESSSELSIRGGTSDQNLVLFDGQTLYNLSHYYGVFSSINPNIIKDIQVYKGGFDSRYGERISGIVDITGKSGNRSKPSINAEINLLSVNLAAEIPVTSKLTFIAAARRSYSDIYKTSFANKLFDQYIPALKNNPGDTVTISEPSFHFYDLHGKWNYRISEHENISFSIYGGKDFYENNYSIHSPSLFVSNTDSNSWHNYGMSVNWQKQWNPSFFSSILIGSSGYTNFSHNNTDIVKLAPNEHEQEFLPDSQNIFMTQSRNKLKDKSLSIRNSYTLNSFNQLNFGALFRINDIYYYKDADETYIYDNTEQSAWISSVYAQDRISISPQVVLKPGFRLTYYSGDQQLYFEPRFAVSFRLTDNLSGRIATGQYNQFISQVISQQETGYSKSFWMIANDSVNPVLKAKHIVTGLTYHKSRFLADIEIYYKYYSGIQEYIYLSQFMRNTDFDHYFPNEGGSPAQPGEEANTPSYFITGKGKSLGIDLFVSYRTAAYTNWFSYTLSKSTHTFDDINYGEEFPALTDQRHQVSFSNLFALGRWNLGAVVLYTTGRPYIVSSSDQMNSPIIRHYERLPDYFRCDLSANYNFSIRSARLKAGMSIINLFNNQNYLDVKTRTYDFENTVFSETNLVQSQKLALNLFLHIRL